MKPSTLRFPIHSEFRYRACSRHIASTGMTGSGGGPFHSCWNVFGSDSSSVGVDHASGDFLSHRAVMMPLDFNYLSVGRPDAIRNEVNCHAVSGVIAEAVA